MKPKCAVKECGNTAILLFGSKWICGNCYVKIAQKQLREQDKLIEEVDITG
jgi:hypothetical protein